MVLEGGAGAQFVESGHIFSGKAGNVLATEFDPVAVHAGGAAITVIDNVRTNGALSVAVSAAGSLVYLPDVGGGATLYAAPTTLVGSKNSGHGCVRRAEVLPSVFVPGGNSC